MEVTLKYTSVEKYRPLSDDIFSSGQEKRRKARKSHRNNKGKKKYGYR